MTKLNLFENFSLYNTSIFKKLHFMKNKNENYLPQDT